MNTTTTVSLYVLVMCTMAGAVYGQWDKLLVPHGSRIDHYARATDTSAYCITNGRIYRQNAALMWEELEQTTISLRATALKAWNDTVVIAERISGGRRMNYSLDDGRTWNTFDVTDPEAHILPHTTACVVIDVDYGPKGVMCRVDYVTGEVQQFQPGLPFSDLLHGYLLASHGWVFTRSTNLDTTNDRHVMLRINASSSNVEDWVVYTDTVDTKPISIHEGIAAFSGTQVRCYLDESVDTIVLPSEFNRSGLQFGGLVEDRGVYVVRNRVNGADALIMSINGMTWLPLASDGLQDPNGRIAMMELHGAEIIAHHPSYGMQTFSLGTGVIEKASKGISGKGLVAAEYPWVAVSRGSYPAHIILINDSDPTGSNILLEFDTESVWEMEFNDGLLWIASDSLIAYELSSFNRRYVSAYPGLHLMDGGFNATKHEVWVASGTYIAVRSHEDSNWTVVVDQADSGNLHVQFADVIARNDGIYVITYRQLDIYPLAEVGIAKYTFTGEVLIPTVVLDSMDMHLRYATWELDDIGESVGISFDDQVCFTAQDNGSTFSIRPVESHDYVNDAARRMWITKKSQRIESYTNVRTSKVDYIVPTIPSRTTYDAVCLEQHCYVNTDAGLYAAPIESVSSLSQAVDRPSELELIHGRLLIPESGILMISTLLGQVLYSAAVEQSEMEIPNVSKGLYQCTLITPSGTSTLKLLLH